MKKETRVLGDDGLQGLQNLTDRLVELGFAAVAIDDLLVDLLDNSLHGDSFTIVRGLREAHDRIAGRVALVEAQPWHRAGN